jgi:hypothetical protein
MAAEDPHLPETRCGIRIAGHAPQKFRFQPLFQAGHRAEGLSAPGLPELTKIYLARQPPAGPRTYNREVLKRGPLVLRPEKYGDSALPHFGSRPQWRPI